MAITPYEYYSDASNHGDYQYVSLSEMVTNFVLNYVGDDKLLNNVPRYNILFHMKRGLQELNYDALKEVKGLVLEIGEDLTYVLPHDYVNYVRVSWLDEDGKFRPMLQNNKVGIATEYLQANDYSILFDNDGYPLTSNVTDVDLNMGSGNTVTNPESYTNYYTGGEFKINTSTANVNGVFMIDKRAGVINFSSGVVGKRVVLEYISDGLEFENGADVKVNKLAEQAMYAYVNWALLSTKIGVQEYVVKRVRKDYVNARRKAKSRIGGFRYNELLQVLRGRDNWIK